VTPPLVFDQIQLTDGASSPFGLEVPAHRAVALMGEEDSGITQLARYALGLSRPARGRVLVYGEEIGELSVREALAFRRRVGYLPAGDGLLQNLSLKDNVALPLRFGSHFSEREIESRLQVMLAAARVQRMAHLRPAQASDEQRRRAAFARALAFDPALVILEHPFDGLSNRAAAELLELARGGESVDGARRAVFIVGQDLPDILVNRVELRYRMVRGRLERE
jgi:ABC-type transporter Mla maintaining outer membrane lipid asymmetry ATPase subunit MlaF